jgi:hypothetical protein
MAKHMLEIELECDFELVGISCHLRDYRLCWTLNKMLDINLVRTEEGAVTEHGNFTMYQDKSEDIRTEITLLVNRSNNGWFIPEQRQADYLLLLRDNALWSIDELLQMLRDHAQILTAYAIDPNALKSKENLLLNDL